MPVLEIKQLIHFFITLSMYHIIPELFQMLIWKLVTVMKILKSIIHRQLICNRFTETFSNMCMPTMNTRRELLLNINSFKSLFPLLYFDLTEQKTDIKDGTTKLTFRYELSGVTATAYSIYALTLYEQDAALVQKDRKLLFL